MTIAEMIAMLQQSGAVERRRLETAALLFAKPNRHCSPSLELVINDQGWVAQITVANVLSVEFSEAAADQQTAVDLVQGVVCSKSYVIVEHRRKWFVAGSLTSATNHHRWSECSVAREWCAWLDGNPTGDESLALRIP